MSTKTAPMPLWLGALWTMGVITATFIAVTPALFPIAVAIAVTLATVAVAVQTKRFLWILLAIPVLAAWEFPNLPVIATVAGTSVYPEDLIAVLLGVLGVSSLGLANRALGRKSAMFVTVIGVTLLSLVRGLADFELGTAVNEARPTLYIIAVVIWVLSRSQQAQFDIDLGKYLTVLGWGLTGIAIVHGIRYGIGASDSFVDVSSFAQVGAEVQTGRPLVSGQALALALAGLYRLARGGRAARAGWVWLFVVILVQHRSVWVATLAALLVLLFYGRGKLRYQLIYVMAVGLTIAVIAAVAGAFDSVFAELGAAATDDRTFRGRTFAWFTLVEQNNALGWFVRLLGQPFGTGYERVNAKGLVELWQPHNWFVVLYLRIGLVGLILVLAILIRAYARNIRDRRLVQIVWLTGVVVFCLAYPLQWYLAPFLAVCLVVGEQPKVIARGR